VTIKNEPDLLQGTQWVALLQWAALKMQTPLNALTFGEIVHPMRFADNCAPMTNPSGQRLHTRGNIH